MSISPFSNGAVLLDPATGDIYPLLGNEKLAHFVVPLPVPLDAPDGWETKVSGALTRAEQMALPSGLPPHRFDCGIRILQAQRPMTPPIGLDLACITMNDRVLMKPDARKCADSSKRIPYCQQEQASDPMGEAQSEPAHAPRELDS